MDPLSLTMAASQLLGAVNTVIVIVARYNEEMNKTPRDLLRFVEELRGLRSVLEQLESLIIEAKKSDSSNPTLQALVPLYEPLTLYLNDLKALQEKMQIPTPTWYSASRRRRSIVAALGWPLQDDEAKRELEKMNAFREQLKDAIQVDTVHLAAANQRMLTENQRLLTELVKSWHNKENTDHQRELYRWLAAPDPSVNYQTALKRRNNQTGAWFIQNKQYTNWVDNSNSFLWLYGIAGCGKSILTTTAIENMLNFSRNNVGTGTAYFYFDFTDKDKQLPEKMVRSVLKQLSAQCPEIPYVLSALFSSCQDADRLPSIDELLETLRRILSSFIDVYVILDALDECSEQEDLLGFLSRIMSWGVDHLHILTSSRPERVIEEGIQHLISYDNTIKVQSDLINDDIRTYIRGRLDSDTKLKRWQKRPDVKNEIEASLMKKADGMFRLVVCQMDELATCFTRPQLQAKLKSLPKTLYGMYASMLRQIPEEHEEVAVTILRWLTYTARPLRIEEVSEVLCVDIDDDPRFDPERRFPDPRDILEICPSLVVAVDGGIQEDEGLVLGERMQLAHYSVKEFLVSKSIQTLAATYSLSEAGGHTSIAESCLAYLLSFDNLNIIGSGTLEEYPLAEYAAMHGINHARSVEVKGRVLELAMELFDETSPPFANWISIYNPDKPWQSPSMAIRRNSDGLPSPLYIASLCGMLKVAQTLIESGIDVGQVTGECGNSLQAASHGGYLEVVQLLIEAGADVNQVGGLYGTALEAAAFCGHEEIVQCLLNHGANVNQSGGKYANALQAASREGHITSVETLLRAGADVAISGGFYGDALQAAAFYGHDSVVMALLSAGANVNQHSGGIYGSALQAAARNGYSDVVERLLNSGALVNDVSGMYHTALQSAARGAQGIIIKRLLEAGADVNTQGGKYGSALKSACLVDNIEVVQQLLDAGANVNAVGGMYGSALQTACAYGYDKVVNTLLDAGANVDFRGGYHGSALIAASKNGHDKIVKQLLNSGTNASGLSISITVSSANHKEVIQMLRGAGADVNLECDKENQTVGDQSPGITVVVENFDKLNIADEEIRQAALTLKFCDECGDPIPDGTKYYHCHICLNDDWDSCKNCVRKGFLCRDSRHKMVLSQIKNGVIVHVEDLDG